MIALLLIPLFIAAAYFFFMRGYLWKVIITIFATFGMYYFLINNVPGADTTIVSPLGLDLTWAICVPIIIVLIGLGNMRNHEV